MDLKHLIKEKAKKLGFIRVGFSKTGPSKHASFFNKWIKQGYQADMTWMTRNMDVRCDSSKLFEGAAAIISFAYPYSSSAFQTSDDFLLARFTEPDKDDYHARLKEKLKPIITIIRKRVPDSDSRRFVDTPPLFEREAAVSSGIGFIGRNTSCIIPDYGSYFFLAEIVTTIEFEPDTLEELDGCMECTACVEACPTDALTQEYSLDAGKCLSYLTIEAENTIPKEHAVKMKYDAGCDLCQEACPFNKNKGRNPLAIVSPFPDSLSEFEDRLGETALSRPGFDKLNANYQSRKEANETD